MPVEELDNVAVKKTLAGEYALIRIHGGPEFMGFIRLELETLSIRFSWRDFIGLDQLKSVQVSDRQQRSRQELCVEYVDLNGASQRIKVLLSSAREWQEGVDLVRRKITGFLSACKILDKRIIISQNQVSGFLDV